MTGWKIRPQEYEVLRAMDDEYCKETNRELADFREREKQRMADEAAARAARKR